MKSIHVHVIRLLECRVNSIIESSAHLRRKKGCVLEVQRQIACSKIIDGMLNLVCDATMQSRKFTFTPSGKASDTDSTEDPSCLWAMLNLAWVKRLLAGAV
ncbi:hypothetical protein AVEN_182539-1 [Araneus ventricosus]|uniref:Uncharacterized protein n=1 Tax=Araneus ventricosus TaxID=182803 RepID=A0A4Y2BYI2_ARAVE|nr:hypothetical protein AVEN_182539-1 [Araneus ventricosus]